MISGENESLVERLLEITMGQCNAKETYRYQADYNCSDCHRRWQRFSNSGYHLKTTQNRCPECDRKAYINVKLNSNFKPR